MALPGSTLRSEYPSSDSALAPPSPFISTQPHRAFLTPLKSREHRGLLSGMLPPLQDIAVAARGRYSSRKERRKSFTSPYPQPRSPFTTTSRTSLQFGQLTPPKSAELPSFTDSEVDMHGKYVVSPCHIERRSRTKGFIYLPYRVEIPKPPDFTQIAMSNRERSTRHKSRIPRPIIKRTSSNLSSRRISSGASSLFATPVRESDDKVKNPFLVPAQSLTITTTKSIYATSQWRSEFPHHVSQEYLEALFSSDQYVPLRASLTAAVDSASYLDMRYDVNGTILGAGEFSEVVKVQDRVTKELFAVKKLKKSVQGVMERKRFLAEARNMWKIGHPNVVSLLGVWEQRAKIYMRMELCRSESLRSAMASHMKYGGFNEGYIWRSLRDISSGLQAIHESNIVHLDIKPENIFIGSAGSLKVGDFGHSVMLPLQDADGLEGDRRYMAPELLYGHCNTYSDIFSLGIMVYEMISNRCSELPGEGREWHSLREGDIDFTAGQYCYANLEAQSSHVERDLSSPAPTLSLSATVDLRIKTCRKNFCKELFDLVKEMMQPICEKRLQAAAICALAEQAGTRFSISSELQAYYSLPT